MESLISNQTRDIEIVKAFSGACAQIAELHNGWASTSAQLAQLVERAPATPSSTEFVALAKTIALRPSGYAKDLTDGMQGLVVAAGGDAEYFKSYDEDGALVLKETFSGLLNSANLARSSIDGSFVFSEIGRGNYILISSTTVSNNDEVWWFVPVSVAGPAMQDLANFNLSEGPLTQHLAVFAAGQLL